MAYIFTFVFMSFFNSDHLRIDAIYLLRDMETKDSVWIASSIFSDKSNKEGYVYFDEIGNLKFANGSIQANSFDYEPKNGALEWTTLKIDSIGYNDSTSYQHFYFRQFNKSKNQYLLEGYFEGYSKYYLINDLYDLVEYHETDKTGLLNRRKYFSVHKYEKNALDEKTWNNVFSLYELYQNKRHPFPVMKFPVMFPDSINTK
ncbi:MAG: hypothetical protein J0L62_11500 [Bacteroidetes bacterium]|nr:hypothetical protein [Bacteroidota bacterium]